jgi:acetyltransferase-like isoleucine patch superfamily enzyme
LDINLHYAIRRAFGRATCRKESTTRLTSRARIINAGGDDSLIRLGAHTIVSGELFVFGHGGRIDIGDWCYVGDGSRIWSGAHVSIGNRVMISHNVNIIDNHTHPISPADRHQHFKEISLRGHPRNISLGDSPVILEDDSWIGAGAIVLKGVTIGRGAIVGAGAVVTRSVAAMTVVAGNPARVIHDHLPIEPGR